MHYAHTLYISVKIFSALLGGVLAYLSPTFPFILICLIAVLGDCYSAYRLSRRVKKKHPNSNDGKFKSAYAKKIIGTIMKVFSFIVFAYIIDKVIFSFVDMYLANIVAGAFCFIQVWSVFENESSCNDSKWAKILQQIMVDKAERHFNIDLSALKENETKPKDDVTNS